MVIEIWSDFACPFCYIGKKKLEKALNNFEHKDKVKIEFKSYELNPNAPLETNDKGYEAFAKLKGMPIDQVKQMFNQLTLTAQAYDLDYQMNEIVMTSTRKAHRLAKWAKTKNKEAELTEELFNAYFSEGLNIANNKTLLNLVEKVGLDVNEAKDVLNNNLFEDEVANQINEGKSLGVRGVPFFVFNRKFAISGAQPDEHFNEALKKAYEVESPFETVGSSDDTCGPDGCEI